MYVPEHFAEADTTILQDTMIDCARFSWDIRLGHNAHTHPRMTLSGC